MIKKEENGRQMKKRIRETTALRLTIEREKLTRDEKNIQKIFKVLEDCSIPCECLVIDADELSFAIRESEREKIGRLMVMLGQQLDEISISVNGEVTLLYVENEHMTCRGIGMIDSSLSLQNIDILMQRYFRSKDRFVIGVPAEAAKQAVGIIQEIIDSDYLL